MIPKESTYYVCIAAIKIDPVMEIDKKNYRQVYLEQRKCKIKKRKLVDFIDAELDLNLIILMVQMIQMTVVLNNCIMCFKLTSHTVRSLF